jgi:uncharacterized coiled-coil protein SlyX
VTLMTKCTLFKNTPALLTAPYRVESPIPVSVFRAFLSALTGGAVEMTSANWAPLSLLSEEFGFDSLSASLSAFRPPVQDEEARSRITDLEERALGRAREIAALQADLARSEANLARLSSAVESLRAEVSAQKAPPPPTATPPARAHPPPHSPAAAGFDSAIVPQIPALLAEFGGKRFSLLWRGTRDGFDAREFHRRCDGHANTLTLIEDRNGNIFGGFTPVAWESPFIGWHVRPDPTLKSFIFTLKNPDNFPPRKFALKVEKKDDAIVCRSSRCPQFSDI